MPTNFTVRVLLSMLWRRIKTCQGSQYGELERSSRCYSIVCSIRQVNCWDVGPSATNCFRGSYVSLLVWFTTTLLSNLSTLYVDTVYFRSICIFGCLFSYFSWTRKMLDHDKKARANRIIPEAIAICFVFQRLWAVKS